MTTLRHRWADLAPVRGALAQADPADPASWTDRLRSDRERSARNTTPALAAIVREVASRCRECGAEALVLTGSTARGRRTAVSDLDFHVIGDRPEVADLPEEIDVYADDATTFAAKLKAGDDFVHWTVWYGCVLWDSGVIERGAIQIAAENAWPDVARKRSQAITTLDFASRLIGSGDEAAAREQVRGALSLLGRYLILDHDRFPLARDELSVQLAEIGYDDLAGALRRTIHADPSLDELAGFVDMGRNTLAADVRLAPTRL